MMDKSQNASSATYVAWVVGALAFVQASSFADRTVIAVLQDPIKQEFVLSDFKVGLLGGLAFSVVYAVLGLPIARLAERRSRRVIIALSLFVWSAMTMLCGYASSYLMLFFMRFGVGIGESGSSPPTHSMIADYVKPAHRGKAMAVMSIGSPIGALLGFVLGGVLAQLYGWRSAFVALGLPGIVLALIFFLTVKEPPRNGADATGAPPKTAGTTKACLRTLWKVGAYRHLVAAQVLMAIPGYGIGAFAAVYLIRTFGFTVAQAGIVLGIGFGLAYTLGLILGGLWHDRKGFGLMPAVLTLAVTPVAIVAYVSPMVPTAVVATIGASFLEACAVAPTYAAMHNRVPSHMRATAIAVLLLLTSLIGSGLGPTLVGLMSDHFAAFAFGPRGIGYVQACPGGEAVKEATASLQASCHNASVFGLRWAIVAISLAFIWAAVHYVLAARRIRAEGAEKRDPDLQGFRAPEVRAAGDVTCHGGKGPGAKIG